MTIDTRNIADAVCHWLEYKRLTGLEAMLGEGLLTHAVAEYLVAHGWKVSAERELSTIENAPNHQMGYISYDLIAKRGNVDCDGGVAIEVKFLKTRGSGAPSQSIERITDDVVKLSCIKQGTWSRYLIVGYGSSVQFYDQMPKEGEQSCIKFGTEGDLRSGTIVPSVSLRNRIEPSFFDTTAECSLSHSRSQHGRMVVSVFSIHPKRIYPNGAALPA